jgi:hypothetical protein
MINTPGFHTIPMADYVRDPAPQPSISTATVADLLYKTPLHAHHNHPRLGRAHVEHVGADDIGSAVHSTILGGPPVEYVSAVTKRSGKDAGVVFTPEDWRTQDAKDAKAEIMARGAIPMLEFQRRTIEAAALSARELLHTLGLGGDAEQTMLFQHEGVWCRSRADYLIGDFDVDVKTCDSADPSEWVRKCVVQNHYDIQAGLRSIGHKALGKPRKMLWLLVEIEPPFAASLVGVAPSMLALAERKATWAAQAWRKCLLEEKFPGYSRGIFWAEVQSYAEADFAQRTGIVP